MIAETASVAAAVTRLAGWKGTCMSVAAQLARGEQVQHHERDDLQRDPDQPEDDGVAQRGAEAAGGVGPDAW